MPLLEITGLRAQIRLTAATVHALDGVGLTLDPGECLGIVGESGSGKTMTALSVMGLLPPGGQITGGAITFAGRDLTALGERDMRAVRGNEIGMIFQDPMTSLDPTMTVGEQIAETVRLHRGASRAAARARAVDVLRLVGLDRPAQRLANYPHQLSGGMRQRVMIAMALACEPKLLIADEPTTALDVTVQKQILELIDGLRADLGMAVILVTHDLGVIAGRTDRALLMYAGQVVETARTRDLFANPRHPYTEALFAALPERAAGRDGRLYSIPGMPPELTAPPSGCRFAARCRHAREACRHTVPELAGSDERHQYRCFFPVGRPGGAKAGAVPAVAASGPRPATAPAGHAGPPVLRAQALVKTFPMAAGLILRRAVGTVSAVSGVSFSLAAGQTFGLVGESGCGKTTIGRLAAGLEEPDSGTILLDGSDLAALGKAGRRLRSRTVQLMFQDSYSSLDPRMRVGSILREPLMIQRIRGRLEQQRMAAEILDQVGLPATAAGRYPHEFSGGQRQRLALARALILRPKVLVADEPVSALDVSIQAQILNLMKALQSELGLAYLLISHNLSVVRYLADTIGVMYLGKLVETGPAEQVCLSPAHPYTRGLIDSVPAADPDLARAARRAVAGEPPSALNPPSGCRFRTRCPLAQEICAEQEPPLRPFTNSGQQAACHFPLRDPEQGADPLWTAGAQSGMV